jgi:uncharacterized protein (TIGR00290 family)
MSTVAISFTGGKDCTLALHRVHQQGAKIAVLVTFSPPERSFKAHALNIIQQQAKALGLSHTICTIHGPDYLQSYQDEIRKLKITYGIDGLVTGDIKPVCSDFMERAVEGTGVRLIRPLWGQMEGEILKDMWRFDIVVSCIDRNRIAQDEVVGERLTPTLLQTILRTNRNVSPTGEYGEMHTMVLDCPLYAQRLKLEADKLIENSLVYLNVKTVTLVDK